MYNTKISMVRGDSKPITISMQDAEGTQIPFSAGDTVYFTIKKNVYTEDILIQKIITEFADGKAVTEILPEETKGLAYTTYVYDIQWNRADGKVKTIIEPSDFIIRKEVTYD